MTKARNIADLGSNDVIETTATGVDVTGTVTADGLTVENSSSSTVANFIYTGGTDAFLGLDGTGTPIYLGNKNGDVVFQTSGSGYADKFRIANNGDVSFYEDTGTTAKMVWDASNESLEIGGIEGSASFPLSVKSGTNDHAIAIEEASGLESWQFGVDSDGDLGFYNSGSTTASVTFDDSGNVGIGTEHTPNALNIYKNGGTTVNISAGSNDAGTKTRLGLGSYVINGNGGSAIQAETYHAGNHLSTLEFFTSGSERARIDSSGNLLVGKTIPLFSSNGSYDGFLIQQNGAFHSQTDSTTCGDFHRRGTDGAVLNFWNDLSLVGSISVSGSSTSYATSSDYRLKENVTTMDNASDRVLALNPCRFNFITDPDTTVDGFLAHEAQEVVPEAVHGTKDGMKTEEYEVSPAVEATYDEDGNELTPAVEAVMGTREVPDYQGIDQSKLVPLLTKALQEALTRIEALENANGNS